MTRAAGLVVLAACLALGGCGAKAATGESGSGGSGSGGSGAAPNTVAGTVQGVPWTSVASAYWIGMPSEAPPAAFIFLFESPTTCASLTKPNWDKFIGNEQVLEIALRDTALATVRIPQEAGIAYLRGEYNPSGDAGTVTVSKVTPAKSITGAFHATFVGDALEGKFEAVYCADGVEP